MKFTEPDAIQKCFGNTILTLFLVKEVIIMLKNNISKTDVLRMHDNLNRRLFIIQNYLCRRETGLE